MRKNKQNRMAKHKCSYKKCINKGSGIIGVYFVGGFYYCSRGCKKKAMKGESVEK